MVVTSVTVVRPRTKSRLSSGLLDHPESEIASEWGHQTFRRKSRMHLPTVTVISLLVPIVKRRKRKATEFCLRISLFPISNTKVYNRRPAGKKKAFFGKVKITRNHTSDSQTAVVELLRSCCPTAVPRHQRDSSGPLFRCNIIY